MASRRRQVFLIVLVAITIGLTAMASLHFAIDWLLPATGGSGRAASSTNFQSQVTIGQTIIGEAQSAHFQASFGFWHGPVEPAWHMFLPVTLKP